VKNSHLRKKKDSISLQAQLETLKNKVKS